MVTDVRTAYDNYVTNVEKAAISKDIFALTRDTRDLVESEYKAGSALVTRLNEAENSVINAQHSLLSAVINASNAKAQLEAAVYAFSDRDEDAENKGETMPVDDTAGSEDASSAAAEEQAGTKPAAVPATEQGN